MDNDEFLVVIDDLKRHQKRVKTSKYLEYKKDAEENLLPTLIAMMEAIDTRFVQTEDVVTEMLQETESVIHPDLAEQLYATIQLGQQLCDAVDAIAALDDVTKKRLADLTQAYRLAANMTLESVAEAAIEPDDDLVDEDPEDEEDEDSDDAEDDDSEDDEDDDESEDDEDDNTPGAA